MKQKSFQQMVLEWPEILMTKITINIYLTPFTKVNSILITETDIKCKTVKVLEDNIEESLDDLGSVMAF